MSSDRSDRDAAPRLKKVEGASGVVGGLYRDALAAPGELSAGLLLGTTNADRTTTLSGDVAYASWNGDPAELEPALAAALTAVEVGGDPDAGQVLGWFVVGPDTGGSIDAAQAEIHRRNFSAWWQIAVALEPASKDFGMFGWRDGKVTRLGGSRKRAAAAPPKPTPGPRPAPQLKAPAVVREQEAPAPRSPARAPRPSEAKPRWSTRMALLVPLSAGVIGGVVLTVYR